MFADDGMYLDTSFFLVAYICTGLFHLKKSLKCSLGLDSNITDP